MFPDWLRNGSIAAAALALSSVHAFGSRPSEDPLLRLVPANAGIVAGIEDPHHGDQSGRLLIVTHSDNADLQDWIALARADDGQHVDRLIEVAASSPRGELIEHLLLARGAFNGRHILNAARSSGGPDYRYDGVQIVELKPFSLQNKEMRDTRWLTVLDDNTVVFGTPLLVKDALDRYASSAAVDAALAKRMRELEPDVNSWSILTMPGKMMVTHLLPGVLDDACAALIRQATAFSVSVHYGSKERIDFAFGMGSADAANALAARIRGPAHLLPASGMLHSQLHDVSVQGNEVSGSLRVAAKAFDPWLAGLVARASAGAHDQNVLQMAAGR
jgi:hypothetical protein